MAAAPRPRALLRMDPLLLLAALGLAACSIITLKGAGRTIDPGTRMYFVERQGIYFGIGIVLALCSRRSTTRGCASTSTACTA